MLQLASKILCRELEVSITIFKEKKLTMKIKVCKDPAELGAEAAKFAAKVLNKAIGEKGLARILLSTGASQFDTLKALVKEDIDWSKVEMFHLDEYVNLPKTHPASFRKYLEDRFVNLIDLKKAYFVKGEGDIEKNIKELTAEIRKNPIDLGLIGIGENAHIAFNDPPADFNTKEAFIVVELDETCRKQQVGEGWFKTIEDVPEKAITMSVYQILQSKVIISCVPYEVKAQAVKQTLESEAVTNNIPATILKTHNDWTLFVDEDSISKTDPSKYEAYQI